MVSIAALFFVGVNSFSQTKSIEEVQSEINTFQDSAAFSVSYNDPKDITTLSLKFDLRGNDKALIKKFKELSFEMSAIYSGIGIDNKPFRNLLCITSRAKRFHFASNNDLLVGIDGETITFSSPDRSTEVKGRKVTEKLCWDIDRELIQDLGNSKTLALKIGSQTLTLSSAQPDTLQSFSKLTHLKPSSKPSQ